MSKETERALRGLTKYLEEHGEGMDINGLNNLASQFMKEYNAVIAARKLDDEPEDVYDYLELAEGAKTKKKKLEYLKKAQGLEPDNLDVNLELVKLDAKTADELLLRLKELIGKGDAQMEEGGYLPDDIGDFWGIFETRPYMRVRYEYFQALIECGKIREAIREGERMLELSENDNLGVRYEVMHLYAFLEEEQRALDLHKRYDAYEETQMLLPLAVLYYKMNQLDAAAEYLKRLRKVNKDTQKFFRAVKNGDVEELFFEMGPYGYRPNCIDELLFEAAYAEYLFASVPHFSDWALKIK